ncbi:MAG: hypothetical protein KAI93_05935, partial [Desulfobacterales bacterium]|nr:hypothetical protein [Desulfobacterales bacterium]
LPDQIATERETTIKQMMSAVSTERKAAIKDITTEREATIKQVMSAISAERKAAIADILVEVTKAMDRAESEGEELVDHTMRQAIVLIAISLIGYIIARLFIQYVSNKMKASAK